MQLMMKEKSFPFVTALRFRMETETTSIRLLVNFWTLAHCISRIWQVLKLHELSRKSLP